MNTGHTLLMPKPDRISICSSRCCPVPWFWHSSYFGLLLNSDFGMFHFQTTLFLPICTRSLVFFQPVFTLLLDRFLFFLAGQIILISKQHVLLHVSTVPFQPLAVHFNKFVGTQTSCLNAWWYKESWCVFKLTLELYAIFWDSRT